jgi:hypothetical protein
MLLLLKQAKTICDWTLVQLPLLRRGLGGFFLQGFLCKMKLILVGARHAV